MIKQALLYMVIMGIQIFLVKLCSAQMSWQSTLIFIWCTAFVIISGFVFFNGGIEVNAYTWVAIIAGILAAVGTIIMYQFLRNNDLGYFVPILSLVPVIGVILAMIFIGEPITKEKIISIILGGVIVFLLAK
jgi:uncharacterized membrane protein